jgi:hypothetical protein
VVAINELSITLHEALQSNNLSEIQLGPGALPIHSLLFADDLIFCGKATLQLFKKPTSLRIYHIIFVNNEVKHLICKSLLFISAGMFLYISSTRSKVYSMSPLFNQILCI